MRLLDLGIRGVLLLFLCYVGLQVLISALALYVICFGLGGAEISWVGIYRGINVSSAIPIMVFETAVFVLQLCLWSMLFLSVIRCRRSTEIRYFYLITVFFVLSGIDAIWTSALFEDSFSSLNLMGLIVGLAIFQMLVKSPRTKAVFVN